LSLNIRLEKGTLNVNAPPGAEIWVDGILKGKAPIGDMAFWEVVRFCATEQKKIFSTEGRRGIHLEAFVSSHISSHFSRGV